MTTRGLEYFIEISDGEVEVYAPLDYETSEVPFQVPVTFASQVNPNTQPAGDEQTAYRMISTPLVLDQRSTVDVLSDDFGDYDRLKWRFFRFEGDEFIEFSDAPAANLDRGKAYWLISKDGGVIDVGSGTSSPLEPFDIVLEHGWNDVAVPFDFPVDWDDIVVTGAPPSEVDGPYGFDGSWISPSNLTRLQPWRGYSVFFSGEGAPTLTFPVSAADAVGREEVARHRASDQYWRVSVSARVEEARDWDNVIGWAPDAIDGTDSRDHREPRGMGGYVSLGFERGGGLWTYDLRAPKSHGDTWRLRLDSNLSATAAGATGRRTALLSFDVSQVPVRFEARLWDGLAGREYDLRQSGELEVTIDSDRARGRDFTLIIGTPEYVSSGVESVAMPDRYQVFVPSPNPSVGSTSIRYQLPEDGDVDLSVYDSAGRRVAVLLSGWQLAGDRRLVWNGRDRHGRIVPAGAYFVKMTARAYEGRQKFFIVR